MDTQKTTDGIPQAYKDGFVFFDGVEFKVDNRVLVPREESETLVLAAMGLPDGARVHEVGTGCGAIALAIKLRRPDLRVTASDISMDACEVAEDNAEQYAIDMRFDCEPGIPGYTMEEWIDLVVANLPYLTEDSIEERPLEVMAEPLIATVGQCERDEYAEIKALIEECPSKWKVALEHDTHMGEGVRAMLVSPETQTDHNGDERATWGLVP